MFPSTTRVLRALENAGPEGCTTVQLCQPEVGGVRFSARLYELRDAGWIIQTIHRPRSARYRLLGHKDDLWDQEAA